MNTRQELRAAFADLVATLTIPALVSPRLPRFRNGEYALIASFGDRPIVTSRNRRLKRVHFEHTAMSVWRRSLAGPELVRVSAYTLCSQWIKLATPATFYVFGDVCGQCATVLRAAGQLVPTQTVDF